MANFRTLIKDTERRQPDWLCSRRRMPGRSRYRADLDQNMSSAAGVETQSGLNQLIASLAARDRRFERLFHLMAITRPRRDNQPVTGLSPTNTSEVIICGAGDRLRRSSGPIAGTRVSGHYHADGDFQRRFGLIRPGTLLQHGAAIAYLILRAQNDDIAPQQVAADGVL